MNQALSLWTSFSPSAWRHQLLRSHKHIIVLCIATAGAFAVYRLTREMLLRKERQAMERHAERKIRHHIRRNAEAKIEEHMLRQATTVCYMIIHKECRTEAQIAELRQGSKHKLELWEQVKVLALTRLTALIYATSLMNMTLRLQSAVIGAYNFNRGRRYNYQMPSQPYAEYKRTMYYFVDGEGLQQLLKLIRKRVTQICQSLPLQRKCSLLDLRDIFEDVQNAINHDSRLRLHKLFLPTLEQMPQHRSPVYECMFQDTHDLLRHREPHLLCVQSVRECFDMALKHIGSLMEDALAVCLHMQRKRWAEKLESAKQTLELQLKLEQLVQERRQKEAEEAAAERQLTKTDKDTPAVTSATEVVSRGTCTDKIEQSDKPELKEIFVKVEQCKKTVESYAARHKLKPGAAAKVATKQAPKKQPATAGAVNLKNVAVEKRKLAAGESKSATLCHKKQSVGKKSDHIDKSVSNMEIKLAKNESGQLVESENEKETQTNTSYNCSTGLSASATEQITGSNIEENSAAMDALPSQEDADFVACADSASQTAHIDVKFKEYSSNYDTEESPCISPISNVSSHIESECARCIFNCSASRLAESLKEAAHVSSNEALHCRNLPGEKMEVTTGAAGDVQKNEHALIYPLKFRQHTHNKLPLSTIIPLISGLTSKTFEAVQEGQAPSLATLMVEHVICSEAPRLLAERSFYRLLNKAGKD